MEFNPSAESVFGWVRDEVLGRELDALLIPERLRESHRRGFAAALANESRQVFNTRMELPALRADGSEILIELNLARMGKSAPPCFTAFIRDITQQKQAEVALMESQGRYRDLVESSHDLIWSFDPDGVIRFMNQASRTIFGREPEEMIGHPFSEFIPKEQLDKDLATFAKVLEKGREEHGYITRAFHKDGHVVVLSVNTRLLRNRDGKITGGTCNGRDVTTSIRNEEANRLQAFMLDQVGQAVIATDMTGNITFANHAAGALYGWPVEEMLGLSIMDVTVPETTQAQAHEIMTRLKRGENWSGEFRVKRRDGTVFTAMVTDSPLLNENGELTGIIGVSTDITERKTAEELIRASEAELRTLSEAIPQIVWTTDAAGSTTYFNHQWMDYTGLTLEESLGSGWTKPFHPDDQTRAWETWQAATQETGAYSLECRLRRADGNYRWWLIRGEPLRDHNGKIIKWLGTCTDVHDLKAAEIEISRVNRALKLLNNCNEALIRASNEHDLLERICTIAVESGGYRLAYVGYIEYQDSPTLKIRALIEAPGQPALGLTASKLGEASLATGLLAQVLGSGRLAIETAAGQPSRLAGVTPGVPQESLDVMYLPLREDEKVFGIVTLVARDASLATAAELKLLQELADHLAFSIVMLRSREQAIEANRKISEQAQLLDAASDAILVRDMQDRIVFWSKSAERVFGYTQQEALGSSTRELLRPEMAIFDLAFAALLEKGNWTGELQKVDKAGRRMMLDCRWTLVRNEGDSPVSILSIETDVTEKKRIEAQLFRAQRMDSIGTLAGGIAHDLNNVLAPILMSVELLKSTERDAGAVNLLQTLENSARHGVELVNQVLSFARGVEGSCIEINPLHLLREIQAMVRNTFPKNIRFVLDSSKNPWRVLGNPTQLHQVFTNLCVNARDAMPSGGSLSITLENVVLEETYTAINPDSSPGPYVTIKVNDTGEGIPKEIHQRIFEPFFTTKEAGKGTGLGLSTTLAIVKSHGGFINLYSEIGKGAEFKVYLPAAAVDKESVHEIALNEARLPRGHGELILIVDDEEAIRKVTQGTLERFGYQTLAASNGAEATAIYATKYKNIKVVLTDIAMPIMDGLALSVALRSMNPNVQIIASSGNASNGDIAKVLGAGVQHFVAKPYTAEALLNMVHKICHSPDQ